MKNIHVESPSTVSLSFLCRCLRLLRLATALALLTAGSGCAAAGENTRLIPGEPAGMAGMTKLDLAKEGFVASGWMGDGEAGRSSVQVDATHAVNPFSAPHCQKWSYTPGNANWAAVAWQYPETNWGDKAGRNYQGKGITAVELWARSDRAGTAVEFFSGGNTAPGKPHPASYDKISIETNLTTEWKRYQLDLAGADLSNVVCPFGWALKGDSGGATVFLDDIAFVGKAAAGVAGEISGLGYVPSGWMGDAPGQVKTVEKVIDPTAPGAKVARWTYRPGGAQRWVAIAWQYPETNWGDKAGKDLTQYRFSKVTFWVRAETPGARVEFFTGGTTERGKPYPASFPKMSRMITLTKEWTPHVIELPAKDWSNVVCAFGWSANEDDNRQGADFFLRDLRFQ